MYKAHILYDGTRYYGWQRTQSGSSIQEELETALYSITGESPEVEAASRTDRGVHAKDQVVQFSLVKCWDPNVLLRALNARLPLDIRVQKLDFCDFHPTLDAMGKEYRYRLCTDSVQLPMDALYSWHVYLPIDWDLMQKASVELLGTHDFSAFANRKDKNSICTVRLIEIEPNLIKIQGDRFLYKMVRNLVGTLVYIGIGKLKKEDLSSILQSKDRKQAGITAPAHGLYLHQVFYPAKLVP